MEGLAKIALGAFAIFGVPQMTRSHLAAWQIPILVAAIIVIGLLLLQRFFAGRGQE
jgi:hypothetical protein